MRWRLLCSSVIVLVIIALLFDVSDGAEINRYVEDFTTKQYCDTLNTTALWDTVLGELKLPPFELSLAGAYDTPGDAHGVAVDGNYAYVCDDLSGLQVIDISNPALPVYAGDQILPTPAVSVFIEGNWAYVADGKLEVLGIYNPENPTQEGSCCSGDGITNVAISGNHAYLTDNVHGFRVVSIATPASPLSGADCELPGHAAYDVSVAGDYAYVAGNEYGLQVIDISDPSNPTIDGSADTPGRAYGIAVHGNYAYIADRQSGLQVIDIIDPTDPILVGACDTPGSAWDVAVTGDYAYVADGENGVQVIDINDPSNPTLSGSYDTPGNAEGLAISGTYVYVADGEQGLQVINVADLISPKARGSYLLGGTTAYDIAIAGDYVYMPFQNTGAYLAVIDVGDPNNPVEAGSSHIKGCGHHLDISGEYAYVSNNSDGIDVVDITDPANPVRVGSCDTPRLSYDVAVSGNYAYVPDAAYGDHGLVVFDISDPTTPVFIGRFPTYEWPMCIAVAGDLAYVGIGFGLAGLEVYDITNPTNPVLGGLCSVASSNALRNIIVSGDYVYAVSAAGFWVIDVQDTSNLFVAGSCDSVPYPMDVAVSGDIAYVVSDYPIDLWLVDISDPTDPTVMSALDVPYGCNAIAIDGDFAYLGAGRLSIVQISQRLVNRALDTAVSLEIDTLDDDILAVSMSAVQSDSVYWQISADAGSHWQDVSHDETWHAIDYPGDHLLWRSTHTYASPRVNPTCFSLDIQWLYDFAVIESISDVPSDEGLAVDVHWTRSAYDCAGMADSVVAYDIYRWDNGTGWDSVGTIAASQLDFYIATVPTLEDSTVTHGMFYTAFLIKARSMTPGVYYESYADSGYSVDNLAPEPPSDISVAYNTPGGNRLDWTASPAPDLALYNIYRDESETFLPDPSNLVHSTSDTLWEDTVEKGWKYHYKICAVDDAGNESDAASPTSVTGDDTPSVPKAFALYQNAPNPFNPTTMIRFDLPHAVHVNLSVYNVKGELVSTIVDQRMKEGRKEVIWIATDNRGRSVASGIYFYRLVACDFVQTRKMVLLR